MGLRVLFIDDEVNILRAVKRLYTLILPEDSIVHTAHTAERAHEIVSTVPLDLIVCDTDLGGTSLGYELCSVLRCMSSAVIIGTSGSSSNRFHWESLGFVFMDKPYDHNDLLEVFHLVRQEDARSVG